MSGGNAVGGNWLEDAFAILASDPSAISALAGQWEQLGTALSTVKTETIDPALTQVAASWTSGGTALNSYGQELGSRLGVMAKTAQDVATGLRGYADLLAKVRADIEQLLVTLGLVAVGAAVVFWLPAELVLAGVIADSARLTGVLTNFVRPAGATASVLALIPEVRSYHAYADGLGSKLAAANADLAALSRIDKAGGILPTLPPLPATPN